MGRRRIGGGRLRARRWLPLLDRPVIVGAGTGAWRRSDAAESVASERDGLLTAWYVRASPFMVCLHCYGAAGSCSGIPAATSQQTPATAHEQR